MPEIEQYANTDEWVEGTLVEQDSEQVNIDNVIRDLEKILDLDSLGQVQTAGPSSAGTSQQHLQEINTVAIDSKGKEKEPDIQIIENFTMTELPETSEEQSKTQIPPVQINETELSNLQTPLNVEKGKKREAKTSTPVDRSTEQHGTKRQRLNPLPEIESVEELSDSQGREDS